MNTFSHFLTLFFLGASGLFPSAPIGEAPRLNVLIELGRGPNCDGRGTCSIEATTDSLANAVLYFDETGKLHMKLKKSAFAKTKLDQQMENDFFQVPSDFLIPTELLQQLEKDTSFQIKSGAYRVRQDDKEIHVTFN